MAVGDGVVWNESDPQNSTLAHLIDDYDRDLRVGVRSRMAREHVWSSSQTATSEAGHHQFITFQQQTAAPTLLTGITQVGALYVGSSGAGYPLMFENSAGSSYTIVNSAGRIQVVTSGTLGSIPICSSANPDGLILLAGPTSTTANTYVLTSVNDSTGGTAAPAWALKSTVAPALGAWVDCSAGAAHDNELAATDGFVIAMLTGPSSAQDAHIAGYTDSGSTPTTLRGGCSAHYGGAATGGHYDLYGSFCMPVRKGDYWRVTESGTYTALAIFWIPLS